MDLRELKAVEIAARAKIPFRDGAWIVPAQSSNGSYRVTIGLQPSCPCDDFQLRKLPCKHILAARLVCAREQDGEPLELDTDAVPKKPTYRQNWPVYNEAQQTEKLRFQKLLFELCRGLSNVEQVGGGRRWTPMADMVFACALKVFTTVSSRRFACDLQAAHAAGYLSRRMNSVSVCSYLENDRLTAVLKNLIVQSSVPLSLFETSFAPDSSGFSTSRFVRWHDEKYGATAFVPFKANSRAGEAGSLWEKMYFYFQFRREEFLKHYHQRSNIESTFSMVKAKFRDHVRSRTDVAMRNEVLCKFLCHNICVVHRSHIELGIAPLFWGDKPHREPQPGQSPCQTGLPMDAGLAG